MPVSVDSIDDTFRRKDIVRLPIDQMAVAALATYSAVCPRGWFGDEVFSGWALDRRVVNESFPVSCAEAREIVGGTWMGNVETRFALPREVDVAISAYRGDDRETLLSVNLCTSEYRYNRHGLEDLRLWDDFVEIGGPIIIRTDVSKALTDLWSSSYMLLSDRLPI